MRAVDGDGLELLMGAEAEEMVEGVEGMQGKV